MLDPRLKNARDLVTKSIYGDLEGKKVVIATVYSSSALGLEQRIEREEPVAKSPRSRSASASLDEKKE